MKPSDIQGIYLWAYTNHEMGHVLGLEDPLGDDQLGWEYCQVWLGGETRWVWSIMHHALFCGNVAVEATHPSAPTTLDVKAVDIISEHF